MSKNDSRNGSDKSSESVPPSAPAPVETGRRDFLKLGGLLFAVAAMPEWLEACGSSHEASRAAAEKIASIDLPIDPTAWFRVARPADMLWIDFNFVGLTHNTTAQTLAPTSSSTPGVILMRFPPQHIEEQGVTQAPAPTTPIAARIAGASQVAFLVPNGTTLPYDLTSLLGKLSGLALNVAPNAFAAGDDTITFPLPNTSGGSSDPEQALGALKSLLAVRARMDVGSDAPAPADPAPTGTPVAPAAPGDSQTAIELPYQLVISPSANLRFAHSSTPYAPNGSTFTELWTTRIARSSTTSTTGADESARVPVSARAIWNFTTSDPITSPPLPSGDRGQLVTQTSDQTAATTHTPTQPFHARRLLLSARGGSLDTLADFQSNLAFSPITSLLSWQHRASFGRDNYVKVEQAGWLFPWGQWTSLVTISERKFQPNPGGGTGARTAYVWQQQFLVILQPVVNYAPGFPAPNWAFAQMRILTPSTPPLDPAPPQSSGTGPTPTRFWPSVGGKAFRFSAQFVDWDQNVHQTDVAAIWIPENIFGGSIGLGALLDAWQTDFTTTKDPDTTPRNTASFFRQRVAYALPKTGTTGTTSVETQTITFSSVENETLPPFLPAITQTSVNIPSLRQFTGDDPMITMVYADNYLSGGGFTPANPGEVYLKVADGGSGGQVDFGAQSQKAGGFLTPSMEIIGLSRLAGPVSGSSQSATSKISDQLKQFDAKQANDPALLFAGALSNAKLFGCFTLGQLFGKGGLTGLLDHASLPKFASDFVDGTGSLVRALGQVQDALTDLQNQAATTSSLYTTLQSDLTTLATDVGNFMTALSALPPGTSYVSTAQSKLGAVKTDLAGLITTVTSAQSSNASQVTASRLSDTFFARALSTLTSASNVASSPQVGTALSALATAQQAATNMSASFTWQTATGVIQPIGIGSANNIFKPTGTTVLKLSGEARAHDVAGKPAGLDITATLNDFDINLVGDTSLAFATLRFKHLIFQTLAGQKPNIDVGFGALTFQGPLSFLNALKDIIPLNGFSDPPGITVNTQGIQGDFSIALPALSFGVFTLENINVGASFQIPFVGEPLTVGFHFSERQNPFHLTVSLLGGGGYFLMDVSLQGVVLIEAALEFGAQAAINLVVASGSVLVMAGVYLRYAPSGNGQGVALTGYVRIAGSLSVLGLITASVEMRLDLGYEADGMPAKSYAVGKATISVEVSILFFSESVDISCEKKFAACSGDPTFADVMGPTGGSGADGGADAGTGGVLTAWNEYCAAFAA